jgi:hypothetical protein
MRQGSFVVHHKSKKPETEKKKLPDPDLFSVHAGELRIFILRRKKGQEPLQHTPKHTWFLCKHTRVFYTTKATSTSTKENQFCDASNLDIDLHGRIFFFSSLCLSLRNSA